MPMFRRIVLLALSLGVAGYALYAYGVLTPGTTVAPAMKATYADHRGRILTHVFCSLVALAVGPLQFFPNVRQRRSLHRRLGYVYFGAVFLGGLAGLAMATIAYGGLAARAGFALLAALWLFTAAAALQAIRRQDYAGHERWAVRSFGLTFAAVTLRIYLGLFFAAGLEFDSFYPVVAWLCWVPNLIVVEWVLLRPRAA